MFLSFDGCSVVQALYVGKGEQFPQVVGSGYVHITGDGRTDDRPCTFDLVSG